MSTNLPPNLAKSWVFCMIFKNLYIVVRTRITLAPN
nr:MAG TPA: hypothetical protein [Caudoviricetes sp.]